MCQLQMFTFLSKRLPESKTVRCISLLSAFVNCFLQIRLSCLFSGSVSVIHWVIQTRSYYYLTISIFPSLDIFFGDIFFDISLATFPKSSGDSGFPLEPFNAQSSLLPSELSSLGTGSLKMHAGECPFSVYDLLLIAH